MTSFAILLTGLSVNAIWLLWSKHRDARLARLIGEHPTILLTRSLAPSTKEKTMSDDPRP
ncbi:hypothetical protein SAQ01S_06910 [Sphingomonas aquatilis NBRC 16722]|uniref:Uncharacterized protein n=1 Tax=Sphingomonas aquatilis TaxID=93063 RepID=A0AAW3TX81_9SPHN|nr:hypothetical protein [Sphingomonas aquatilis]MBB3876074.1 hypothetical protein [Sphingomonas aquatilis]GEM70925.1 hypothetical protein SAQ01S_06910 [Sphingomonas aquatilis NBRC 16722]